MGYFCNKVYPQVNAEELVLRIGFHVSCTYSYSMDSCKSIDDEIECLEEFEVWISHTCTSYHQAEGLILSYICDVSAGASRTGEAYS